MKSIIEVHDLPNYQVIDITLSNGKECRLIIEQNNEIWMRPDEESNIVFKQKEGVLSIITNPS